VQEPTENETSAPRKFQLTCAEARDQLASAIDTLNRWGVRVAEDSRLHEARLALVQVAIDGAFPADPGEARSVVNALITAQDFAEIAARLPPHRVAEVRKELQISVDRGSVRQNEDDRQPYQLQSQHWVGTVLDLGGLSPSLPPVRQGKSPDFFVYNGTAKYGVEVKRPVSEKAIRARLQDAIDQLTAVDVYGAVVLDLTDCMKDSHPDTFVPEGERLGNVVDAIIWDEKAQRHHLGFERIIMATAFARGAWSIAQTNPPRVGFVNISASSVFAAYSGNLRDHHAKWLRESLKAGLFRAGFDVEERRRN
jgi:hypothetical protein